MKCCLTVMLYLYIILLWFKVHISISRIADYVNNIVATRVIPAGKKGVVVMKLDVEVGTALK